MIRQSVISLLLLGTLSLPLHGMHAEHDRFERRDNYRRPHQRPNLAAIRALGVAAGVVGCGVMGSLFYGIIDGQSTHEGADHIQLYEAVRLQQSWLLHRVISGSVAITNIFKRADKAGIKRSTLYKEALKFAEEIYDHPIARILHQRLTVQEQAELMADSEAAIAQATQIPAPVTTTQPQNETPLIAAKRFDAADLISISLVTAAIAAAGMRVVTKKKYSQDLLDSRNTEADLNKQLAAANAHSRDLQAQILNAQVRANNLQNQVHGLNGQINARVVEIAALNQQLADARNAPAIEQRQLRRERDVLMLQVDNYVEERNAWDAERVQLIQQANNLQRQLNQRNAQPVAPAPAPAPAPNNQRPVPVQNASLSPSNQAALTPTLVQLADQANRLLARAQQEREANGKRKDEEDEKEAKEYKMECTICMEDRLKTEMIYFHPPSKAIQERHLACIDCLPSFLAKPTDCPNCRENIDADRNRAYIKSQLDIFETELAARRG